MQVRCADWMCVCARSLAELGERVQQLQQERTALAQQLAAAEAERDAALGDAAAAAAEVAAADRLNRLLEVRVRAHCSGQPCQGCADM